MSTKHDECCSLEEVFEAMIVKLEKFGQFNAGRIIRPGVDEKR